MNIQDRIRHIIRLELYGIYRFSACSVFLDQTPSLEEECCYLGLNLRDVVVSNPPETTFEEL